MARGDHPDNGALDQAGWQQRPWELQTQYAGCECCSPKLDPEHVPPGGLRGGGQSSEPPCVPGPVQRASPRIGRNAIQVHIKYDN